MTYKERSHKKNKGKEVRAEICKLLLGIFAVICLLLGAECMEKDIIGGLSLVFIAVACVFIIEDALQYDSDDEEEYEDEC